MRLNLRFPVFITAPEFGGGIKNDDAIFFGLSEEANGVPAVCLAEGGDVRNDEGIVV